MSAEPSRRTVARARELLVLASMMAAALWGVFLVDALNGTGRGRLSGLPIGTDFVYFYTLAHVGHAGNFAALASNAAFYRAQMEVVPAGADTPYPPVYPPQLAVLLSPLARLSYGAAYATWIALTLALYALVVWRLAADTPELRAWPAQVAAVAAANPALWFAVLHGQMSVLALVAFALAWAGLRTSTPIAAGSAIGLLAFKPSLFVPAIGILLLAREWRIVAGALLAPAAGWVALLPWVGVAESLQYIRFTMDVLRDPDQVASNLSLMHSLRTFWSRLLPPVAASVAYIISAGAVVGWTARFWHARTSPLDRIGVLAIGVVLASPHLFAYDLLVLVPALLAAAARVATDGRPAQRICTTAVFTAPLWGVPLAVLGCQASTIAVATWLVTFGDAAGAQRGGLRR